MTLTTSKNQKNNVNNNISLVDLGECEAILRRVNSLSDNETIYMKKTDIKQEGMKIPKIEYDVYHKNSEDKLVRMNLSVCEKTKVFLYIPVEITENIDLLNSNSAYYNSICYQATSENGTDITLKDRKKEFITGNKTLCQEDCNLLEYNQITQKALCSCTVKESSSSFEYMTINKTKLLENFRDIKRFLNINILYCFENLFVVEGMIYNIGFYILSLVSLFHIISFFIFFIKKISMIRKIINDIIFGIRNVKLINTDKNIKEDELIIEQNKTKNNQRLKKEDNNNILSIKRKRNAKKNKKYKIGKKDKSVIKDENKSKMNSKNIQSINIDNNNKKDEILNNNLFIKSKKKKQKNKAKERNSKNVLNSEQKRKTTEVVKNIMKYIEDEINSLPYNLALVFDNRTFCEFYVSLIKTKNNLIFSFFFNKDYNSRIIKIDLFFISFAINYTVNALFFDDNTMHKIYENKGKFDIEYQLPKIIYSSLISMVLNTILKLLALSNDSIINFKQDKNKEDVNKRGKELESKLKIKFYFT